MDYGMKEADDVQVNIRTFYIFEMILMIVLPVIIVGILLFHIIRNRRSPKLTVEATVVSKRKLQTNGSASHHFVKFQVESGDCIELYMAETDCRKLLEDDFGKLTFQGTRYLGFEKIELFREKKLRVLDVFSWLPESEISLQELEDIFVDHMNGNDTGEYKVSLDMPDDVNEYILDSKTYLLEEGKKVAYVLKDDKVIAVVGYRE